MHCHKAHILIAKRLKEGLSDDQWHQLDLHLQRCESCRHEVCAIHPLVERILSDAPNPNLASIRRPSLETVLSRASARSRRPRLTVPGYALACSLIVLWFLFIWPFHHKPSGRPITVRALDPVAIGDRNRPGQRYSPGNVQPDFVHSQGESRSPQIQNRNLQNRIRRLAPDVPASGNRSDPSSLKNSTIPDSIYLDGRDPQLAKLWGGGPGSSDFVAIDRSLPPVKDDFVRVPWPQVAAMNSSALESARRWYEQQAQIVDTRLFRKVTLHEKGVSLESLCATLEKQTGVKLSAARAVRDEKATVLLNDLPARDVMREIARLFDCFWSRSGEDGGYEYEVRQDLKTQLAEEELRNRDIDAGLIALDQAVSSAQKVTPEIQTYLLLTPAERRALRAGKEISFGTDQELPPGFPAGWSQKLLDSWGTFGLPGGNFTPGATPGFVSQITFSLVHSELGQVSLEAQTSVRGPGLNGIARMSSPGTGRSPSSTRPDNRVANNDLEQDPAFRKEVSFAPTPCARQDIKKAYGLDFSKVVHIEDDIQVGASPPMPHVNSADVWEAVHEATRLPIVADYYTHLYPAEGFKIEKRPLFNALCQVGDSLGVHWKKDGDFLICRSASFFWDKLKEVPNRQLDKWQADRERTDGLPLDDLLEMALLSDQQLDSKFVGQGVTHCRDLMEWNILSNPEYAGMRRKYDQVRPLARFLATLPRSVRMRAASRDGMPLSALAPGQQEALLQIVPHYRKQAETSGMQLRVDYIPAGRYVWNVLVDSREQADKWLTNPPLISGKTREETLEAARRIYPHTDADSIRRSYGQLALSFAFGDGSSGCIGKRPPAWRAGQ